VEAGLRDHDPDVAGKDLRENLANLRLGRPGKEGLAKLPLDCGERRLDVAALVIAFVELVPLREEFVVLPVPERGPLERPRLLLLNGVYRPIPKVAAASKFDLTK
jgi:hypothetical protein